MTDYLKPSEGHNPDAIDVTRREHDEVLAAIGQFMRRSTWILRGFVAILVGLAIAGTIIFTRLDGLTADIHDSVCALRTDLEKRVAISEEFLEENPEGSGGISDEVVEQGITNQENTIEALSSVEC